MLVVEGLGKTFGKADADRHVFRNVDLVLDAGGAAAVFGPNGVGKSTLLRCIAGLLIPDEGNVRLVNERSGSLLKIAYLFDGPKTLRPRLTARENLRYFKSVLGLTDRNYLDRALALLGRLSLGEIDKPLQFLSRGSQQKVNIALGLAAEPALLVCDEPSSFLDSAAAKDLALLLREAADDGAHVLIATHNYAFAVGVGAKLLTLSSDGLMPFDRSSQSGVIYLIEFHDVERCIDFALETGGEPDRLDPRKVRLEANRAALIFPCIERGEIKAITLA